MDKQVGGLGGGEIPYFRKEDKGKEKQEEHEKTTEVGKSLLSAATESGTSIAQAMSFPKKESVHLKQIHEEVKLRRAAQELFRISETHPLLPSNIDAMDANDVYITKFAKKGIPNVVFKVGNENAQKANFCYQLTRICSLEDVVVPAKSGVVKSLVSREDYKASYVKIQNDEGRWLIKDSSEKKVSIKIIEKSEKETLISHKGRMYTLVADKEKKGCYHIKEEEDEEFSESEGEISDTEVKDKDSSGYKFGSFEDDFSDNEIGGAEDFEDEVADSDEDFDYETAGLEDYHGTLDDKYPDYHQAGEVDFDDESDAENESLQEQFGDDPVFLYSHPVSGKVFLLPHQDANPIVQDHGTDAVLRNGVPYQIVEKDNTLEVIGKDVPGMVQIKVEGSFFGPSEGKFIDARRTNSPETKSFFNRIDMKKFSQAFLATVIFRPQDGKVDKLNESNYLFQAVSEEEDGTSKVGDPQNLQSKLCPVLIDLDETMPRDNKQSQDPELTDGGKKSVSPVRTGLMMFPQSCKNLSTEEKRYVLEKIGEIVSKKKQIDNLMKGYSVQTITQFTPDRKKEARQVGFLDEQQVKALDEVLDRLDEFQKNHGESDDWLLEDILFAALPEYKKQWDALGDLPRDKKAQHIGFDSLEDLQKNLRL